MEVPRRNCEGMLLYRHGSVSSNLPERAEDRQSLANANRQTHKSIGEPHRVGISPISFRRPDATCAAGSRSAHGKANPRPAPASGSPPGPCSTDEYSADDLSERALGIATVASSLALTHRRRTSIRHARPTRAVPSRQHQASSSDSSRTYCFVAFRVGMIVFRKAVCSSSRNGTRNT